MKVVCMMRELLGNWTMYVPVLYNDFEFVFGFFLFFFPQIDRAGMSLGLGCGRVGECWILALVACYLCWGSVLECIVDGGDGDGDGDDDFEFDDWWWWSWWCC